MPYTLSAENGMTILLSWIDASYAIHHDMRGHTGGAKSFGLGMFHCMSGKQKLNAKSSTESELIGASDYLPHVIQAENFINGQGYHLKENRFYQDNKSTMQLEKNGRRSCGQKS